MNNIKDTATVVEQALTQYREARESDTKLIYLVMRMCGVSKDESFASVMNKMLNGQLPAFASITRAKRKVVEQHPELDCSAKTRELRNAQEEAYKAYARG